MSDEFYRAFEDKYRGQRKLIKSRVEVYLPFVLPLNKVYPQSGCLDIGCGRGEWLELLKENEMSATGIDFDEGMLKACLDLSLNVELGDGITQLFSLEEESLIVISAFHVVEHISFEELQTLVKEALRVLKPGGILILETPNPENIKVATENFYLDPTHIKPIPSQLLSFLPEFYGFERTKVLRLQENKALATQGKISLGNVIEGASPDYAVIAQKKAGVNFLKKFDDVFALDFGLSLTALTNKFDSRLLTIEANVESSLSLEEELNATKSRIEKFIESLAVATNNVEHLENQLEEKGAELLGQQAANHALEEEMSVMKPRIEQFIESLAIATNTVAQLEGQLKAKNEDLSVQQIANYSLQEQLDDIAQKSNEQSNELDEARVKIDELHQSNHHWWLEAEKFTKELHTVHKSKSWRITWPLRKAMQLLKWLFRLPVQFVLWVVCLPKRVVRWIVVKAMAYTLSHPKLKMCAKAKLRRYPKLEKKLRLLAQAQGLVASPVATTTIPDQPTSVLSEPNDNTLDLSQLTPSARRVYGELKAAMEQSQKENS